MRYFRGFCCCDPLQQLGNVNTSDEIAKDASSAPKRIPKTVLRPNDPQTAQSARITTIRGFQKPKDVVHKARIPLENGSCAKGLNGPTPSDLGAVASLGSQLRPGSGPYISPGLGPSHDTGFHFGPVGNLAGDHDDAIEEELEVESVPAHPSTDRELPTKSEELRGIKHVLIELQTDPENNHLTQYHTSPLAQLKVNAAMEKLIKAGSSPLVQNRSFRAKRRSNPSNIPAVPQPTVAKREECKAPTRPSVAATSNASSQSIRAKDLPATFSPCPNSRSLPYSAKGKTVSRASMKSKLNVQGKMQLPLPFQTEGQGPGRGQGKAKGKGVTRKREQCGEGTQSPQHRKTPEKQATERDQQVLTPSEHSEFCYTPTVVKPEVAERCKFDAELATKLAEATKQIKDPARRRSPVLFTASDSPVSLTSSSSVKDANKEAASDHATVQPSSGTNEYKGRKGGANTKARDSRCVDRHKLIGRGNIQI